MKPLCLAFLAAVALLGARVLVAAEPPGDDPLPKGAKLRLAGDRLTYRYPPSGTLLPPDYKTFLIADVPLGFRRYDAATGKPLDGGNAGGHPGGSVVVSGDGKRAVVVHTGILTIRDTATGKAIRELKPPPEFGTFATNAGPHVSLSGDGALAAQGVTNPKTRNSAILVWDVDKGTILLQFEPLQKGGALPVLSADGRLLATRGTSTPFPLPGPRDEDSGHTIQVWDVGEKKELFRGRVSSSGSQIPACSFSPDGTLLAAGCADGPIDLWDVKTQKLRATLLGRTGQGLRVAFSPDGKTLAAVGTDGAVQRWATADGKPLATTEPPEELPPHAAQGMAFAENDRVIVWGAVGSSVVAWESPSGKFLRPPGEHTAAITSIAFADGGKQILTAGLDGRVVKWDSATGKPVGAVALRPSRAFAGVPARPVVNLAPDASRALSIGNRPAVFDLLTGAELFTIPHRATIEFNSFTIPSADVTRAVTVAAPFDARRNPNGTVAVWDLVARKKVAEMELPIAANFNTSVAAALSPSGNRLVVARFAKAANANETVLVVTGFDLRTGKTLGDAEDHDATGLLSVAAASEVTAVVSTTSRGLRLFNYEDGRAGDVIETGSRGEPVSAVVFAPDGKRFAFGVALGSPGEFGVRILDWPSGKAVHTFTGHRAPVTALAFSPDGKTLASGSADTAVLLWDLMDVGRPK